MKKAPAHLTRISGDAVALSRLRRADRLLYRPAPQTNVPPFLVQADFTVDVVTFGERADFLIADPAFRALEAPEAGQCRAYGCLGARLQ